MSFSLGLNIKILIVAAGARISNVLVRPVLIGKLFEKLNAGSGLAYLKVR